MFFFLLEKNLTEEKQCVCISMYKGGENMTSRTCSKKKERKDTQFYSPECGSLERSVVVCHEHSEEYEASSKEVMGRKTTSCFYSAPSQDFHSFSVTQICCSFL